MNIYCFSTLSFAKLQFKSVINKAFHKHGVASFTDAWIETHIFFLRELDISQVASFTDAWIETHSNSKRLVLSIVASFTDAWIETKKKRHFMNLAKVASFTDAWIETGLMRIELLGGTKSHLLQMRGLKLPIILKSINLLLSHLLQMRGLKQD